MQEFNGFLMCVNFTYQRVKTGYNCAAVRFLPCKAVATITQPTFVYSKIP